MGFSRQVYWSGQPLPSPGDLPDPGIESGSPALQADSLPSEPPREVLRNTRLVKISKELPSVQYVFTKFWEVKCLCIKSRIFQMFRFQYHKWYKVKNVLSIQFHKKESFTSAVSDLQMHWKEFKGEGQEWGTLCPGRPDWQIFFRENFYEPELLHLSIFRKAVKSLTEISVPHDKQQPSTRMCAWSLIPPPP